MKGGSRRFKVDVLGIELFAIYMKKRVILMKLERKAIFAYYKGVESKCLPLLLMKES